MKRLKPDYFFRHYTELDINWLKKKKIKTILSDLDSTLIPHNENNCKTFEKWSKQLKEHNIELIVVSNNHQQRVNKFTDNYNLLGYGHCNKPFTKKIKTIIKEKNIEIEKSILIGDQVFTDILSGKKIGIKTALIYPLGSQEPFWISFKRIIENIFIKQWVKKIK